MASASDHDPPPPPPPPVGSQSHSSLPNFSSIVTIKLTDNNFLHWKQIVEAVIHANCLERFVACPRVPPRYLNDDDRVADRMNPEFLAWEAQDQLLFIWLLNSPNHAPNQHSYYDRNQHQPRYYAQHQPQNMNQSQNFAQTPQFGSQHTPLAYISFQQATNTTIPPPLPLPWQHSNSVLQAPSGGPMAMVAAGSNSMPIAASGSSSDAGVWYVDSGATHNVTADIANLQHQLPTNSCGLDQVYMGQ